MRGVGAARQYDRVGTVGAEIIEIIAADPALDIEHCRMRAAHRDNPARRADKAVRGDGDRAASRPAAGKDSPEIEVFDRHHPQTVAHADRRNALRTAPVSYTHLTLPTICSV